MAFECKADIDIMADLSDVESALAALILSLIYPQGLDRESTIGAVCRVYRGWPAPATLNTDLAAGYVNVTISPLNTVEDLPEVYFDKTYGDVSAPEITAMTSGEEVIFSGSTSNEDIIGLWIDGATFTYSSQATESLDNTIANMAALVAKHRVVSYSGARLSIPGCRELSVRVFGKGIATKLLRRERRRLQLCCWCPTPILRDMIGKSIDLALSKARFIHLQDHTDARLKYVETKIYDQSQNASLYRRDLVYICEYAIISENNEMIMVFGSLVKDGVIQIT